MATKTKAAPAGRLYTRGDWDDVSHNPEWTAEEMAKAKPFAEVLPELAASARRVRGKQKAPTKQLVSLRLDRSIIEAFKAEARAGRAASTRREAVGGRGSCSRRRAAS